MGILTIVCLGAGVLLLLAMLYHAILHKRPGIYPAKRLLKQRAAVLGGAGVMVLLLGIVLAVLTK